MRAMTEGLRQSAALGRAKNFTRKFYQPHCRAASEGRLGKFSRKKLVQTLLA
jgi:hypothetical protein